MPPPFLASVVPDPALLMLLERSVSPPNPLRLLLGPAAAPDAGSGTPLTPRRLLLPPTPPAGRVEVATSPLREPAPPDPVRGNPGPSPPTCHSRSRERPLEHKAHRAPGTWPSEAERCHGAEGKAQSAAKALNKQVAQEAEA